MTTTANECKLIGVAILSAILIINRRKKSISELEPEFD